MAGGGGALEQVEGVALAGGAQHRTVEAPVMGPKATETALIKDGRTELGREAEGVAAQGGVKGKEDKRKVKHCSSRTGSPLHKGRAKSVLEPGLKQRLQRGASPASPARGNTGMGSKGHGCS